MMSEASEQVALLEHFEDQFNGLVDKKSTKPVNLNQLVVKLDEQANGDTLTSILTQVLEMIRSVNPLVDGNSIIENKDMDNQARQVVADLQNQLGYGVLYLVQRDDNKNVSNLRLLDEQTLSALSNALVDELIKQTRINESKAKTDEKPKAGDGDDEPKD